MNEKGNKLNKKVWMLFEKAGFKTKPNSHDSSEEVVTLSKGKKRTLDLSAREEKLGITIIGWNKARKDLKESLTVHIHDYKTLKKIVKADSVLFVSTGKSISKEDKEYAEKYGMRVWGKEELYYYEAIVDAIGKYAKYEIIHSFGIETHEEKHIHNVLALHIHQPHFKSNSDLFFFTMTPEKLLKTCAIYRKAQGSGDAYQRMVRKSRLSSVKKFVTQENALLPPNIIVHFNNQVRWDPLEKPRQDVNGKAITLTRKENYELVVLSIPMTYASLELIDGQHRLYGFVEAEPATKENYNLVVLGMAKLPSEKRRDTFVAINDNSRRMDPNLVSYLKYTDNESECQKDSELMAIRIVVELNKTYPFKNKIRLLDITRGEKITLKGFSGYDLRGLLSPKGLFRKYYPENTSAVYISALRLYFNIIKSLFRKQWQQPDKYIIFANRGISAFLKLLKSILKNCQCRLDSNIVKKYIQPLRKKMKDSEWEIEKLKSSYVGGKGWKDFHRDLVNVIRDDYPKFKE